MIAGSVNVLSVLKLIIYYTWISQDLNTRTKLPIDHNNYSFYELLEFLDMPKTSLQ